MGDLFNSIINKGIEADAGALAAPFNLAEAGGTLVYNNLLMPGLNAIGLSRKGSVASLYGRDTMINPDLSLEGISGLLGIGKSSGFTNMEGTPIARDAAHGSAYSSALANVAGEESYNEFANTIPGQVVLTAADIGVDPMTSIGLASGINAAAKGTAIASRAKQLLDSGMDAKKVARFVERAAGPRGTFIEQMIGLETPHDYFTSGRIFNRKPMLDVFGKGREALGLGTEGAWRTGKIPAESQPAISATPDERVSQLLEITRRTGPEEVDSILRPTITEADISRDLDIFPRQIDEVLREEGSITPTIDDLVTSARKQIPESAIAKEADELSETIETVWDAMPDEQILDEAKAMAAKRGLYGDVAEEVAQDAVARTWESVGTLPADPNRNAVGKLRQTLRGHVQHAIRDAQSHVGGLTNVPKGEKPGIQSFDLLFPENTGSEEAFSLTRRTKGNQKEALDWLKNRKGISFNSTDVGMEIITSGGKKAIVKTPSEIGDVIEGKRVAGRTKINAEGVGEIDLTRLANKETADHELVHWAKGLGLFEADEWNVLTRKYASGLTDQIKIEEAIADGLAKNATTESGIIQRIKEFFAKLYEAVTGNRTATGVESLWREGGVLQRKGRDVTELFHDNPLDRVVRRRRIQSLSEVGQKGEGLIEKLGTAQGRSRLFDKVAEKLWDDKKIAGKAIRALGGDYAYKFFRTLPGLLSNAKNTIINGISVRGRKLYDGNMVNDILEPVAELLRKRHGSEWTDEMFDIELTKANAYAVSKRAVGLYDQAMEQVARFISGDEGGINLLRRRGIVSADDVNTIENMDPSAVGQFFTDRVDKWSMRNTGLGYDDVGDLDEARAIIRQVESNKDTFESYKGVMDTQRSINEASAEYAFQKGMIDEDTYKYLQDTNDYTPLQRIMEESVHGSTGGTGVDLLHALKGSERRIKNPVVQSVQSAINWMRRSDINEVFDVFLSRAEPDDLAAWGITRASAGEGGNIKIVMMNGEKTYWKFADEDLFNSLNRIGRAEPQDDFAKVMGVYKRIVRESVTHSPGFPIRNFIRDSVMRALVSRSDTGLADVWTRFTDEEKMALIAGGGDQAGWYGKIEQAYADELRKSVGEISKRKDTVFMNVKDAGSFLSGKWEQWGDFLANGEMHNRLVEFRSARKRLAEQYPNLQQWEIDRLAGYEARDLMDFAVMGEWGRKINTFVPFFNAAVQGTSKILRTAQENPARFLKRLSQYVVAPSVGTYLYNQSVGAGDEYRELPAYRRDLYWNFKVGDKWLTIPKPFEAGVLGTIPERIVDYAASGDATALQGVFPSGDDLGTLVKSASPIDEALLAGPFRPILEIVANKDLFRDRYIIPPYEEGLDPELRKGVNNASGVGKMLSSVSGSLGFMEDPRQWDYLTRGLFSEYGRILTDFSGKSPNYAKNLTGGFMRENSPWGLQTVQDVMREGQRKGQARSKEHRAFIESLRGAGEGNVDIDSVLRNARNEERRLSKINIEDILRKRTNR